MTDPSSPIRTVEVPCLQCGAENGASELWTGVEHEYDNTTNAPFHFVRCGACGLVRLNPRPEVEELGRIYPPNYYAYGLISDESDSNPSYTTRAKIRMYQQRIEQQVERLGKTEGPIRLLDIGCADGRLLDWYKESPIGDRLEITGVELSEEAVEIARARGHNVYAGRFEIEERLEPGTFDLIIASHVIEHVDEPKGFAQHAAKLLAPGGVFIVATPNWDSKDAKRFRKHWGGNHFPRHWMLYDETTISTLADSVGLNLEFVEYQVNPVFWNWTVHSWLKGRFPQRSWPDRLFPTVKIFHPGLQSFVLLSMFTTVDLLQRRLTGKTASMSVELRKPR